MTLFSAPIQRMCILVSLALAPLVAAEANTTATGFLDKTVMVNDKPVRYALYVPDNYDPAKKWPLIVFLHGSGERGDDNMLQTDVGIGHAIRLHRDWFPALVLMPQCPDDKFWDTAIPAIEAAMAQTQTAYSVDDNAITLTGLSLGGYATWIWGATKTETFAALLPICGGGDMADLAGFNLVDNKAFGTLDERVKKLATIPIWAFHGTDDDVVPPARSRDMVERVDKAGGKVRYKEFKETGHNSWDQTYDYKRAMSWLLKQRKK
jgi:predicted peptidase